MSKFEEYVYSDLPIKKELLEIFKYKEPEIIFDIGACECEDSIRYSLLFKNASIFSFEPHPGNYQKCLEIIEDFNIKTIKPYKIALGQKNGFSKFHISKGNPDGIDVSEWNYGNKSSSLYPPDPNFNKYEWLKFEETVEVETQTIDFFCTERLIPKIDFIHLDVQGAELDVLKGGGNMIKMVTAIWLEVEKTPFYKNQPLKKDIENFMSKAGFLLIIDTAYDDAGDQLYVNSLYFSKFNQFIWKTRFINILKWCYAYLHKHIPFNLTK